MSTTVTGSWPPASRTPPSWTPAAPPADYVLGHVRAVLPDRLLEDARIVVREGRIAAVEKHPPGSGADVDGQGLLCVPGLIDTHSDGLENEQLPRPGAELPIEFALLSFEGKLRAAGVTTVFHGISFEDTHHDIPRSVGQAEKTCKAIDAYPGGLVDHRILYRLDVRSPESLSALARRLDQVPDGALVSHEDHTPGQGQYAVREYYERYLMGSRGLSEAEAREHVDQLIADRDGRLDIREEALIWLAARSARIRLLGHDPSSAAEIAELRARGCAVAEFPTTIEAAEAARAHGLPVVIGAPNILRGRSHNGNASGRDLVGRGLVTALVSDYLPSGLLAAAMLLAEQGLATLPAAIGLVTAGPAEVAGLPDRGRLEPGLRADLVLVEPRRPWPAVRSVLSSGGVW
ncbi:MULTISPECIES: alpha-D-ribose 1-methylphosphonate 5-triphosphate diphosphatase [unclassified Frankia]